jgi:hypothetical protein
VAAAKRKKTSKAAEWSWRLAGIALCAFFALGVAAGLSRSGHSLAQRLETLFRALPRLSAMRSAGTAEASLSDEGAVALVERRDGFYALDAAGGLRGPIAPVAAGDLAVISGAGADAAGAQLLDDARLMIRAETSLGPAVSEMRVSDDRTATLFLEQPAFAITLDLQNAPLELERVARILALWRGRQGLIAAIDLTTADQAVVRIRASAHVQAASSAAPRVGLRLTSATRSWAKPSAEAIADR